MFIRKAMIVLPVFLLFASPATSMPDAAASDLLQKVQQSLAKSTPASIRITAAGSSYTYTNGTKQSYWIKQYTSETNLAKRSATETLLRVTDPIKDPGKSETDTADASAPWPQQVGFWLKPFGFLTAASGLPATVSTETLLGTMYQVITISVPNGKEVRGYVNSKNVLERIRTSYDDPSRGTVQVEAIFDDWGDFNGVKFPRMVIRHENQKLSRVLIVKDVATGATHT
jgi:hypothetical protein